jgi:hypothetical protein
VNQLSREEKLATFKSLTKLEGIKTGSAFEESFNTARLLFEHPHGYRDWRIVGPSSVPGFFHLESTFRLDPYTDGNARSTFHLCFHESQFTRIH